MWSTVLGITETLILCVAATLLCHRNDRSLAESMALGIVVALASLSVTLQSAFLLGNSELSPFLESFLSIAALVLLYNKRNIIYEWTKRLKTKCSQNISRLLLCSFLSLFLGSLLLKSLVVPQFVGDVLTYHLPRVLLAQDGQTLLFDEVSKFHIAVFPFGSDILTYIFLRFGYDYGVAFFSFISYVGILLGTYGLSRQYCSSLASTVAALCIGSMPQVIVQATIAKNNIFPALAALSCIILFHRLYHKPTNKDLILLAISVVFGVSTKTTFLTFALPFFITCLFFLMPQYSPKRWVLVFRNNWRIWLILCIPLFILSQAWLFFHNIQHWQTWSGPEVFVTSHKNNDGLRGGAANVVRFMFQGVDLLPITNKLFQSLFTIDLSELIQSMYYHWFDPIFQDAAVQSRDHRFELNWRLGNLSGFGPTLSLLVWPATTFSLLQKKEPVIRLIAGVCIASFLLFCLMSSYSPYKHRMLILFVAPLGVLVGNALEQVIKQDRQYYWMRFGILVCTVFCMTYAYLFDGFLRSYNIQNWARQLNNSWLFSIPELIGAQRYTFDNFDSINGRRSHILAELKLRLEPKSKVFLFGGDNSRLYHYLVSNPEVYFTSGGKRILKKEGRNILVKASNLMELLSEQNVDADYILCLEQSCDKAPLPWHEVARWPSDIREQGFVSLWRRTPLLPKTNQGIK
jgi:4-amino-4-deoxy-L-arabinose transferase-like glycosyltransferase